MINQRRNDERRSLEAARLLLLEKTIETQEKHIKALESLLAECASEFVLIGKAEPHFMERDLVEKIDAILPATEKPIS